MTLETFKNLFFIENSYVKDAVIKDNTFYIIINNDNYQYATGNGFRDERSIECEVNYKFTDFKFIEGDLDISYIVDTIVKDGTITFIGDKSLTFSCKEIFISGGKDENI